MFERIGLMFSTASLNIPLRHIYLELHSTYSMTKKQLTLLLMYSQLCPINHKTGLTAIDLPEGVNVHAFLWW